jgi:hypothetical protein
VFIEIHGLGAARCSLHAPLGCRRSKQCERRAAVALDKETGAATPDIVFEFEAHRRDLSA